MIATKLTTVVLNVRIMLALLVKDWRIFRAPIIGVVVSNAACYLISPAGTHSFVPQSHYAIFVPPLHWAINEQVVEAIWKGAFWSVLLTALLASAFGGTAFARERKDRSADFLGMMPVTRAQIMLSKILICSFVIIGSVAASTIIGTELIWSQFRYFSFKNESFRGLWDWWGMQVTREFGFHCSLFAFVSSAVALFGVGWLLSTFSQSVAISTCISIAVTLGAFVTIEFSQSFQYFEKELILISIMLLLGIPTLLIGTFYYRRRIEP